MAYVMVKACKLESCSMKARRSAKFPILSMARANEKKNRGFNFAIWRSVFPTRQMERGKDNGADTTDDTTDLSSLPIIGQMT